MTAHSLCRICGQLAALHSIEMVDGVAHTVSHSPAGRRVLCSLEAGSHERMLGELDQMRTIIRSLRNRAGRAYRQDRTGWGDALSNYAAVVEQKKIQLIRRDLRWHARYPVRRKKSQ